MSDNDQEVIPTTFFSRYRSPTFSKAEVEMLVNLIDKYKFIILNKSTSVAACHAKELTWAQITKVFNAHDIKHKRSTVCLKMKWDNLKKEARKVSKNLLESKQTEYSELTNQIVTMMYEAENSTFEVKVPEDIDDGIKEPEKQKEIIDDEAVKYSEESDDKQLDESTDDDDDSEKRNRLYTNRSMNFSIQECRLLLKCVRSEKKHIFSKEHSGRVIKLKNRAWSRVTEAFNKQSPHKRTTKVLRTKFYNMNKINRRINRYIAKTKKATKKHVKLIEDCNGDKLVKDEPVYEVDSESMEHNEDIHDDQHYNENPNNFDNNAGDMAPDPLSMVLNSDSGIGSTTNMELNMSDNKEIADLKKELLNYKLETAKLKRKRLEEQIEDEAKLRKIKATEAALRLRAARLEAVAAEMKLPAGHPALLYTQQEALSSTYLSQYNT